MAKIALNEALGRRRGADAASRQISFDDPEESEEANYMANLISSLPSPEQNVARGEVRHLLEAAIDALPDAYRMTFILCGVEEMSVAETADCLDVEPATVKTRYHRARNILRQQLSGLVDSTAGEAFSFDGVRCDRIVSGVFLRLESRKQV
jgi:RNA polymerase sigma-70 factor, ECF subfamily